MSAILEKQVIAPRWVKEFAAMTDESIRAFATCIGDFNPLHHDDAAAKEVGLLGIIAPGVKIVGLVSSAIAERIPTAMVHSLHLKFRKPLYAGRTQFVQCELQIQRRASADFSVIVATEGSNILAEGACTIVLPR